MAKENIFDKLKRIFSNDIIIRDRSGKYHNFYNINKQIELNNLASNFLTNRMLSLYSSPKGLGLYQTPISIDRISLYKDYERMDTDSIISSALDIYADETTTKNEFGLILTIVSENEKIKEDLENLFYDILNIEYNLWGWVRNMVKYGDFFIKLNILQDYGIIGFIPISVYDITREDQTVIYDEKTGQTNLVTKFYIENYKSYNLDRKEFYNYEIGHFRLLSDVNYLPYGKSIIEGARKIWKQLTLMEDAMLIYRILRAPEKRIFKIEVGNLPPYEVENYIRKIINETKRIPVIDPATGDYNLKYNIESITEDYYLPVRGGQSGTSIETLGGLQYSAIEDIEYLRNKLMAALKIPKAFLGYEEGIGAKATLAGEDLRFARTIERIQKIVVSELYKLAYIHLKVRNYNNEDLANFELKFSSPSSIYESEKLELWEKRISIANNLISTNMFSMEWIYNNIFNMSKDELDRQLKKVIEDKKNMNKINNIQYENSDIDLNKEERDINNIDNDSNMFFSLDDPIGDKDFKKAHKNNKNAYKIKYKGGSPLATDSIKSKVLANLLNDFNINK